MPLKIPVSLGAGHGGQDSGVPCPFGAAEKEVTLALCTRVAQLLLKTGRFEVFLVRTGDEIIPTERRAALVRNWAPRLHVEFHLTAPFGATAGPCVLYACSKGAAFARLLAQKLCAPLGGQPAVRLLRPQTLLRGLPWEQYYALLPALTPNVPQSFFVECGAPQNNAWATALAAGSLPVGLAEAAAGALCAHFGVPFAARSVLPAFRAGLNAPHGGDTGEYPAALVGVIKDGLYYIRERPGPAGRAIGIAEGGQEYPYVPEGAACRLPYGEGVGYLAAGALVKR